MNVNRSQQSKQIFVFLLLSLAVLLSGCEGEDQFNLEEFVSAVMASCGEHTLFLQSWYLIREPEAENIIDPIGGYIYLYWIDEGGNVCHGEPGVSGQPGPVQLLGWTEEAYTAAKEFVVVSANQLNDLQTIPFDLGSYSAGGLHFAQFSNWYWRARESGQTFSDPGSFLHSIPEVVSLDGEFCLLPILAQNYPDCMRGVGLQAPDPEDVLDVLSEGPSQDPAICQTRVMPNDGALPVSERVKYCLSR
jgi:hypothetical protein